MRISLERSGGFAGILTRTTIDEKDLAPDEAQKLRELVEAVDFFNLSKKIMPKSPQPDRFQYQLSLEESGRQHTVTASEETLPANLKLLVNWLMEKARQKRRDKESR